MGVTVLTNLEKLGLGVWVMRTGEQNACQSPWCKAEFKACCGGTWVRLELILETELGVFQKDRQWRDSSGNMGE